MERLTKQSKEQEFYVTEYIAGKMGDEGYYGEAIEKLAKFENLYDYLLARKISLPEEMEKLRNEGKNKSYKFKEIFAQKLMNEALLALLSAQGL